MEEWWDLTRHKGGKKKEWEKNLEKVSPLGWIWCHMQARRESLAHSECFGVGACVELTLWWKETSGAWRRCLVCCCAAVWAKMAANRSSPPSRREPTGTWFSFCWTPAWRSCATARRIRKEKKTPQVNITSLDQDSKFLVASHPARSGGYAVLLPSSRHWFE